MVSDFAKAIESERAARSAAVGKVSDALSGADERLKGLIDAERTARSDEVAALKAEVAALTETVAALKVQVDELSALLNKGKALMSTGKRMAGKLVPERLKRDAMKRFGRTGAGFSDFC